MTLMRWGKDWPIPTGSTSAESRSVGVLGVEGLSDRDQRAPACCSDEEGDSFVSSQASLDHPGDQGVMLFQRCLSVTSAAAQVV